MGSQRNVDMNAATDKIKVVKAKGVSADQTSGDQSTERSY